MSGWGWPQVVVALLTALGFAWLCVKAIRDTSVSAERAALMIAFYVAYYAGYAYTLHAGGLW